MDKQEDKPVKKAVKPKKVEFIKCIVIRSFIDKYTAQLNRKRDIILLKPERYEELKDTFVKLAPEDAELTVRELNNCSPCKK